LAVKNSYNDNKRIRNFLNLGEQVGELKIDVFSVNYKMKYELVSICSFCKNKKIFDSFLGRHEIFSLAFKKLEFFAYNFLRETLSFGDKA